MRLPDAAEIARARRLVALVGAAYAIAQLALFSLDRAPGWDESIYLSQVTPGAEPLLFAPSRARGITFLVAPILQLGGSLTLVRLFLVLAAAAALAASFALWAPVIGRAAAAAALLFAGTWPTLIYGSEVMPNLWVAFPAVAAAAILGRRLAIADRRGDEPVVGLLLAAAAIVRPLDATVLAGLLIVSPIVVGRRSWSWTGFLALGLAAGWAPWLVEMSERFGGPIEALEAAARVGHAGVLSFGENVRRYLAFVDGPTTGSTPDPPVPALAVLALVGLIALAAVGVLEARRRGRAAVAVVPAVGAATLAVPYVVLTSASAPRFLLPAVGLVALPAGLGLAAILHGLLTPRTTGALRTAAALAAVVLISGWVATQVDIAAAIDVASDRHRDAAVRAGAEIRRLAAGEECRVFSSTSYPMVGYAARCRSSPMVSATGRWDRRAARFAAHGVAVFAVFQDRRSPAAPAGTSAVADVPADRGRTWFVFAYR